MSIKRFFTDRFGRVRPITEPNATTTVQQPTPDKPLEQPVHYIDVRQEGFKDGVLEIDKKHFEAWIGHSESLEAVKHKLQTLRADLNRYTAQLFRTETDNERLQVEIAGNTEKLKHQETLLRMQEEKKQLVLQERATLRGKLAAIHTHYGPVLAFLFLLAGFALLAADFAISDAIVGRAFNMNDGYEKYLFASGMAVMAFAIKPAIDRYFEKNYNSGNPEDKRKNHLFLIAVAVLVLSTLGVLGYFRGQAESKMKLIDKYDYDIRLNTANDGINDAARDKEQNRLNQEKQTIQQELADNPTGKAAFVMLALVFALAGALCLSLSFPALEGHAKKTGLRFNLSRSRKAEEKLETIYLSILQAIADLKSSLEQARTMFNCLPALEPLETKVQVLKDQIQEQVEEFRRINTETLTATYNDAFEEALAHEVEGKPTIYWKEVPGLQNDAKTDQVFQVGTSEKPLADSWLNRFFGNNNQALPEQKHVYVHQKLRKLIQERRLN